jgi:hypothetical protein
MVPLALCLSNTTEDPMLESYCYAKFVFKAHAEWQVFFSISLTVGTWKALFSLFKKFGLFSHQKIRGFIFHDGNMPRVVLVYMVW